MKNEITKDTILANILDNPKNVEILEKHNFPCLGCPCVQYEMNDLKLGQICGMYQIDLEKLLEELNKAS
jgi:hybrid cluster-associated redox disulfide protein